MTRSHKAAPMVVAPLDILKFVAKSGGQVTYQQVQDALRVKDLDARKGIANCRVYGWLKSVKVPGTNRVQQGIVSITAKGGELLTDFGYEADVPAPTSAMQGVNPFNWRNFSSDLMLVN